MIKKLNAQAKSIGRIRTVICAILAVAVAATLIFIFSNSAKPPVKSEAQSNGFKDKIEQFIPDDPEISEFILTNIRKLAHFTEYGLLGIEISLIFTLFCIKRKEKYKCAGLSLLFALVVAFFDETVQIFFKRGPAVIDMWIDIGGFFTYSVLTYILTELAILAYRCVTKLKIRKNNE